MKTYIIEMMDNKSYNEYMSGGYVYTVEKVEIEATSAEEAIAKTKTAHPEMHINTNCVRTTEEIATEKARFEAEQKARQEKEEATKAKRIATEKAKAEAVGMTVEEYRAEQRRQRKIKKLEREIAEAEANLAKMKKYLEDLKK